MSANPSNTKPAESPLEREVQILRLLFQMNARFRLEVLASLSKTFRDHGVTISDSLLSSLTFAISEELPGESTRPRSATDQLTAFDAPPIQPPNTQKTEKSQPPDAQPPQTGQPPGTQPPPPPDAQPPQTGQPPAGQPPDREPPLTGQPPTAQPPQTQPPPPAGQPPAAQPPQTQPPQTQPPPAGQPPTAQPPQTQPPPVPPTAAPPGKKSKR